MDEHLDLYQRIITKITSRPLAKAIDQGFIQRGGGTGISPLPASVPAPTPKNYGNYFTKPVIRGFGEALLTQCSGGR